MTIIAAADGSALGNPGPAGWAWYVDDECWASGGWPHGTNNQGELMAVLDLFRATAHVPAEHLHVLCDSQYVINAVTKWMPGWKRKGWRKGDGKPVLNLELLQSIDEAIAGRDYSFEWVRGHAGHRLNEAADDRARAVASAYQSGSPVPTGPGYASSASEAETSREHDADGKTSSEAEAEAEAEPDLLSELADADGTPAAATDEQLVVAGERRLLDSRIDRDTGELAVLLHPDFEEIGPSGRSWDRETKLATPDSDTAVITRMDQVSAERIGPRAMLVTYRGVGSGRGIMTTSLWINDGQHWRLRHRQGTPEVAVTTA